MNCSRAHQSDSIVVNRSISITLGVAPLDYNSNVLSIIMNSGDRVPRRRWQT